MLYFTANTLTITETYVNCRADNWLSYDWGFYDSAGFNGTATELSCNQVQITGNTTGEQVTINWNSEGDMTFSSTDSTHKTLVYYAHPYTCPNTYPWWYYGSFIRNNQKINVPAAKRAVRPSVPRIIRHSRFFLFR